MITRYALKNDIYCQVLYLSHTHYKKYTPCLGINRGSSLFIGISYGADPNI